jgi:hypothetical protein
MVERAADQKLDGYRALASRLEASDLRAYRLEAALLTGAGLLAAHQPHWIHEVGEEGGEHDEDCRACEYDALLGQLRAALKGEENK